LIQKEKDQGLHLASQATSLVMQVRDSSSEIGENM